MCVGELRSSLEVVCIMVGISVVFWGSEELPGGGVYLEVHISDVHWNLSSSVDGGVSIYTHTHTTYISHLRSSAPDYMYQGRHVGCILKI